MGGRENGRNRTADPQPGERPNHRKLSALSPSRPRPTGSAAKTTWAYPLPKKPRAMRGYPEGSGRSRGAGQLGRPAQEIALATLAPWRVKAGRQSDGRPFSRGGRGSASYRAILPGQPGLRGLDAAFQVLDARLQRCHMLLEILKAPLQQFALTLLFRQQRLDPLE